jgi:hypothetical protein
MPIPYTKIGHALNPAYQTGQSAGEVDRHQVIGNPAPVPGVTVAPSHLLDKEVEDTLNVVYAPRKCALILTPFLSEFPTMVNRMARYAKYATVNSIKRHEAPISTNLFYYDSLQIHVSIEKDIGLQSMLSWVTNCDLLAIYGDYGITQAMNLCIKTAKIKGVHIEYRNINMF